MPKDLVYNVRIKYDDSSLRRGQQKVSASSERAEKSVQDVTNEIRTQIRFLDLQREKGTVTARELTEEYGRLERQLEQLPQSLKGTISAQERLLASQRRLGGTTQNFSKAQSNANQVLFSFGDIANDAQQFSFGAAQGMRAIGNNIGFVGEQFANTAARAGGFRGAITALGSSLLGPGGLILGINLAVSAMTVFGDELFSTEEKVKDFGIETKETSEILNDFIQTDIGEFVDSFESIEEQARAIDGAIESLIGRLPEGVDIMAQMEQIVSANKQEFQDTGQIITDSIFSLQEQDRALTDIEQRAFKILQNKQAELEAQKLVNQFAREHLDILTEQQSLQEAGGFLGIGQEEAKQAQQAAQARIESRQRVSSLEQEIEQDIQNTLDQQSDREKERIKELEESHLLSIERQKQARLEAERIAQREAERAARQRFMRISTLAGITSQAISALFDQSKTAAIASAIINGAQAITRTFAQYGFTPFGIGAAAAQAAVTAAQIAKIQRTTIDDSGSGGSDTSGGGNEFVSASNSQFFQTTQKSSEPANNTPGFSTSQASQRSKAKQPINVVLAGEFDDRVVSVKAERGRRLRENKTTAVRD